MPISLKHLFFSKRFNQALDNLPNNLKSLTLDINNKPLTNLPISLKTIIIVNYIKANDIKLPYGCKLTHYANFNNNLLC